MIKKAVEYIKIPKKLFYGIVITVVLLLALWSLKPEFTPVDLGEVKTGVFHRLVVDEGMTYFLDRQTVSAPADGITPKLSLEVGDVVKKGQVLFSFLWDNDFKMKSDLDGYILKIYEKDRRHVPRGTPILEIGNPDSIEIQSKLLSEEVVDVKVGQKVIVKNWGKPQDLEAEVTRIEPTAVEEVSALGVKEQRVKVHMKITSDEKLWKGLGDGFRVEVSIVVNEIENAKLLPVGALMSADGKPAIFVFRDKKLHLTPVEIGFQNRNYAQLKTDLPEGTKIVLYPGSNLSESTKVKPR